MPLRSRRMAPSHESLHVQSSDGSESEAKALELLEQSGAAILFGSVSGQILEDAKTALAPTVRHICESFDTATDTLKVSTRRYGIIRHPAVGVGKRNVHFDPHDSDAHLAMAHLAQDSNLEALIREHAGEECTLSETGFSVTRPGGEGMEWHADGVQGEMTILMSLEDVSGEQGSLGIVPASHKRYAVDKNDAECDEEVGRIGEEGSAVWYPYRAGVPVLIDARTLHCAKNNESGKFRVILWWIYNTDG